MHAAPTAVRGTLPTGPIVDPLAAFSKHRRFNAPIARALGMDWETAEIAKRMSNCAGRLGIRLELPEGGPVAAHLESARLCGCRLCPFCEWRRTRAWRARVIRGLTKLQAEHPAWRAIFLTLTVRNCPLPELASTIGELHAGWGRLVKLAAFPTAYWLRRTEITFRGVHPLPPMGEGGAPSELSLSAVPGRSASRRTARDHDITDACSLMPLSCHPHLHGLLIVPATYFGAGYIRQTRWREMWAVSARLDYAPVVDVRNVYRKGDDSGGSSTPAAPIGAVCEAAKYATKASDVMRLGRNLPELHRQLRGIRLIGVSKALQPYVPAREPLEAELMDEPAQGPAEGLAARVAAVWDESAGAYRFAP